MDYLSFFLYLQIFLIHDGWKKKIIANYNCQARQYGREKAGGGNRTRVISLEG